MDDNITAIKEVKALRVAIKEVKEEIWYLEVIGNQIMKYWNTIIYENMEEGEIVSVW
jgi:hypothetical protein